MLVIGIISIVAGILSSLQGIALTLIGNQMNRNFQLVLRHGSDPGWEHVFGGILLIVFGILLILVGITLLVLRYWKKHRCQ